MVAERLLKWLSFCLFVCLSFYAYNSYRIEDWILKIFILKFYT